MREALVTIAAESHRVECLQLRCTSCKLNELSSLFSSPSPMLKYLYLSLGQPRSSIGENNASGVLASIFANDTPNLKVLKLQHVAVPWSSPLFGSSLTELTILHLDKREWPSVQEFMAILARCPLLETITLGRLALFHDSAVPLLPTLPKVQLNNLKHLVLRVCDALSLGAVLGRLQAPIVTLRVEL